MDFFALQRRARRATRQMVVLFALGVVAIVVSIDVMLWLLGYGHSVTFFVWSSLCVVALIAGACWYRRRSFRGGGLSVAQSAGATRVPSHTTNPVWRRLQDIVAEMAVASGIPAPTVHVLEYETGINAFAAGYGINDAVLCVTQGSLDNLTRDELQGVIGHEFSHIVNGDMRLNTRLISWLFGILFIGMIGRGMMDVSPWVTSRGGKPGWRLLLQGLAMFVLGYVGYFFGRLIQAAVARSRERLADASAVQFTRLNDGLANALKKMAALPEGSTLYMRNSPEVAHMLLGEGVSRLSLFPTHPSLLERIQTLQPGFDSKELVTIAVGWSSPVQAGEGAGGEVSVSGLMPAASTSDQATSARVAQTDTSGLASVLDKQDQSFMSRTKQVVGALVTGKYADNTSTKPAMPPLAEAALPEHAQYRLPDAMYRQMPAALTAAAEDSDQAPWLLHALAALATGDAEHAQRHWIETALNAAKAAQVQQFGTQLQTLDPYLRLPLATVALGSMTRLPRSRQEKLMQRVTAIVEADAETTVAEYCLSRMIHVLVLDVSKDSAAEQSLASCATAIRDLFAILVGHGDEDESALRVTCTAIGGEKLPEGSLADAVPEAWPQAMDAALAQLARLSDKDKQRLVTGLTHAVLFDKLVTVRGAELLHVVCASLHCSPPDLSASQVL